MSRFDPRHFGIRLLILVATVLLTWLALLIGQERADIELDVGSPSPETFTADAEVVVPDEVATQSARDSAADAVEPIFEPNPDVNAEVLRDINELFDTVAIGVTREPREDELPPEPETEAEPPVETSVAAPEDTTPTTLGEGETPTEEPAPATTLPETTSVEGSAFLDADGDGLFDAEAGDAPMSGVQILITGGDGSVARVETDTEGRYEAASVVVGEVTVDVNEVDPDFPSDFLLSTGNDPQTVVASADVPVQTDAVGYKPLVKSVETQVEQLRAVYPSLQTETIDALVALATEDVMRLATGRSSALAATRDQARARADVFLQQGLSSQDDVRAAEQNLASNPPPVFIDDEYDLAASQAAANVVSLRLRPNLQFDEEQTVALQEARRTAIDPIERRYRAGETIVRSGELVTAVALEAIQELGLLRSSGPQLAALAAVVAVLVALLAFYLARFRPTFWGAWRRVALFGLMIVLGALAVQATVILGRALPSLQEVIGYAMPAAALGFMAAILFDARIAVLLAIANATLAAVATQDPALAIFAPLATVAPVPFVSSISTRGDLRRAVVYTALTLALVAGPIAWFFHPQTVDASAAETVQEAVVIAAGAGLLSTLLGLAALSFLEVIFDITTTLRLLDLTDRNHPALLQLQEAAWGTFSHSLMVGTLAEKAARRIGANNLLALAAAYYHDLGKTENPTFFIENQIGISNPHDRLPPEESAAIIRQHVTDGVALAARYKIPADVAEGIRCHHGDGVMRYFYEKAKERYGADNVDIDDYRHNGHKPATKEMAILMMADAVEGACRAVFQDEDPSSARIREVVEKIVAEKVSDGQLGESTLTLGDLTLVKQGFVDALIGHYHQRIPYPNFPDVTVQGPALRSTVRTDAESPR